MGLCVALERERVTPLLPGHYAQVHCNRGCVKGDVLARLAGVSMPTVQPTPTPRLASEKTRHAADRPWPAPEDGVVIDFGLGWNAEAERIFHNCGPDVRTQLGEGAARCECGAEIPRIVEKFRIWLAEPSAREEHVR